MKPKKELERVTKGWVKALLSKYPDCWWDMPVPSGWGKSQLDFTVCFCGLFLAIETKRPDESEWLTGPQRKTAWNMYVAGATVFIIATPDGVAALQRWLERVYERALALGAIRPSDQKPIP